MSGACSCKGVIDLRAGLGTRNQRSKIWPKNVLFSYSQGYKRQINNSQTTQKTQIQAVGG